MANVLTAASKVHCGHQGAITLVANSKLKVNGSAVVTKVGPAVSPDCTTQVSNSTKKCTTATPSGGISKKLMVGGSPAILDTLSGVTDGAPPGTVTPIANQNKLRAS